MLSLLSSCALCVGSGVPALVSRLLFKFLVVSVALCFCGSAVAVRVVCGGCACRVRVVCVSCACRVRFPVVTQGFCWSDVQAQTCESWRVVCVSCASNFRKIG